MLGKYIAFVPFADLASRVRSPGEYRQVICVGKDSFARGERIRGRSYAGAKLFDDIVYAATPSEESGLIMYREGWDAECVTLLGRVMSSEEATLLVLKANFLGYQQQRETLSWAAFITVRSEVYDALDYIIAAKDGRSLYEIGVLWPDRVFSPTIVDALIRLGDAESLYDAGQSWPDSRFNPSITEALIATKNAKYLYVAGHYWKDSRFTAAITDALVNSNQPKYLFLAGRDWKEARFRPDITQALIKTACPKYLYLAGRDWPDERYTVEIAEALLATQNKKYLKKAKMVWAASRLIPDIIRFDTN